MDSVVLSRTKGRPKEKAVITIGEAMALSLASIQEYLHKSGLQLRGNADFQLIIDQHEKVHGYILKLPNGPLCFMLDKKTVKGLF